MWIRCGALHAVDGSAGRASTAATCAARTGANPSAVEARVAIRRGVAVAGCGRVPTSGVRSAAVTNAILLAGASAARVGVGCVSVHLAHARIASSCVDGRRHEASLSARAACGVGDAALRVVRERAADGAALRRCHAASGCEIGADLIASGHARHARSCFTSKQHKDQSNETELLHETS